MLCTSDTRMAVQRVYRTFFFRLHCAMKGMMYIRQVLLDAVAAARCCSYGMCGRERRRRAPCAPCTGLGGSVARSSSALDPQGLPA